MCNLKVESMLSATPKKTFGFIALQKNRVLLVCSFKQKSKLYLPR